MATTKRLDLYVKAGSAYETIADAVTYAKNWADTRVSDLSNILNGDFIYAYYVDVTFESTGSRLSVFSDLAQSTLGISATSMEIANVDTIIQDRVSPMIESVDGEIIFKGNLVPDNDSSLSIGSETNKIKDLFVSANTIHLGESTTLSGTTITIDGGENPTSLNDIPTMVASSIIAKPFVYNPGTGSINVRPNISFQDLSGNNYPISFDTINNKFSFDALGNYGQGSIVAKNIELNGTILLSGYDFSTSLLKVTNDLRVDGNVNLGYDASSVINLKGTTSVQAPITFKEGATLGDGNDDIIVNSGAANDFTVTSRNFTVDSAGKVQGINLADLKTQSEKVATIDIVANSLVYTDENGNVTSKDLSIYLDDTNLARLVSGTYNSTTKKLIFTRDDNSTFDIDASDLFSSGVVTSVNGSGGAITLSTANIPASTNKGYITDAQITKLAATSGTNTGDEVDATETTKGIVELATLSETNSTTDSTKAVTPGSLATLKGYISANNAKISNVTTDLSIGNRSTTTLEIVSSDGTNASVPSASITEAGMMSSIDKVKLNGIATGAQVNVASNIAIAKTGTGITVNSSTGTGATIPGATSILAGVMVATDKAKLDSVEADANNYEHPTTEGNLHLPSKTSIVGEKFLKSDSTTSSWSAITKADVGLANVDNTADSNKSVNFAVSSSKATKLTTPRSISLSGVVSGSVSFDGSANVTLATTINSSAPKGTMLVSNGSAMIELAPGTDGQILVSDSTSATGVKWINPTIR